MSDTLQQVRQRAAKEIGIMPFLSGTADAGGDANTIVDADEIAKYNDNTLRGAWVYAADETPTDTRIISNDQSASSADVIPSVSSTLASRAYEILPFSSDTMKDAVWDAIDEAFLEGWLGREFEISHFITGSPVYNGGFHWWTSSSVLHGWTAATVTLAERLHSAGTPLPFNRSAALYSGSAGTHTLIPEFSPYLQNYAGNGVTLKAMLYSSVANEIRAQLMVDGSVVASTDYHAGSSKFQLLQVDYDIPETAIDIRVRIDVAGVTGTPMAAAVWVDSGAFIEDYPMGVDQLADGPEAVYYRHLSIDETNLTVTRGPRRTLHGWSYHRYQALQSAVDVGVLHIPYGNVPTGAELIIPVTGPLTKPTVDADLVETGLSSDSIILGKLTARILLKKLFNTAPISFQRKISARLALLDQDIERLAGRKGMRDNDVAPLGVQL